MAERRRRPRLVVAWVLTAGIAALALLDDDADVAEPPAPDDAPAATDKLRITAVSDAEVVPGDALTVTLQGVEPDPDGDKPLSARVGKRDAQVLSAEADRLIVRIPSDLPPGKSSIRVYLGVRRSKPHDLLVRQINLRKVVRNLVGGLALLIVGLWFLSRGLRGLAGRGMRAMFERLTAGTARGVAAGAVLGGVTQMTTATAGATIGFLEARLVALPAAVALLFGAQLGAAATGVFLPVTLGREALLIVAAGTVWITAAGDRRSEAFGHTLLGAGFLLYGLHLCRLAFDPLVADPYVAGWVESLQASSLEGRLAWMLAGVLLAAVLQGPAPVFALVLALAQTSGALGLTQALAILAGTDLGAGLLVLMVSWSASRRARQVGMAMVLLGGAATVLAAATVDVWGLLAEALVPGQADELSPGAKVLMPGFALHLAVAFVMQKLATTLALAGLVPWTARRARGLREREAAAETVDAPAAPDLAAGVRRDLAAVVRDDQLALDAALAVCRRGERGEGVEAEHALRGARRKLEALFGRAVRAEAQDPSMERARRAIIAVLQMQLTLEDLLRVVEHNVEVDLVLAPGDVAAVERMHELVVEGLDAVRAALAEGGVIDLDRARAREIQLNAREAEAREALLRDAAASRRSQDSTATLTVVRVGITDLLHAYENIGNPLYRVCQSLAADVRSGGD